MLQDLTPRATNLYDVLLALVTLVIVPLVTSWITQRRIAPKIEEVRQEAVASKVAAVDALQETVAGNQSLGEVQKAVNGDKDKLTARIEHLEAVNKGLEAQLAGRRMGENR